MDALIALLVVAAVVLAFDVQAIFFGRDLRWSMDDHWARFWSSTETCQTEC